MNPIICETASKQELVSEIFSSLQGEGPKLGERHLFIRFDGCHMKCRYCDESSKKGTLMSDREIMAEAGLLERLQGPHSYVSLTGGEPLLFVSFLKELLPALKAEGFRVLLETSGVLGEALAQVIGWCDLISMDFKLPSVTGERNFEAEHRQFLACAIAKEVYVKMVVSNQISFVEFDRHINMLHEMAPEVPLILQPLTDSEGRMENGLLELMMRLQQRAFGRLKNVQVLPRLHSMFHLR